MERAERTGELVKAEDVRRQAFARARLLRDRLLAIPDRLASTLAATRSARSVASKLREEITSALLDAQMAGDEQTEEDG
jgi:phage terminase Nu1 subunit (DNA packaging protein)